MVRSLGDLGTHARGRTLAMVLGATAGDPPAHGVALATGKDAQQHSDRLAAWIAWAAEPGRLLVLLPPFAAGESAAPTRWEARRAEPLAGGETALARALARERRHELRGELTPIERIGGQVVTASWRKHPAAGLMVITALPLGSLLVLDQQEPLRAWMADLLSQAGDPRLTDPPVPDTEGFLPCPDDWTLLLHLCTGPFTSEREALHALESSSVLRLDGARAEAALARLTRAGWVQGGSLKEPGSRALSESRYASHAAALRRMRRV